MLYLIDSSAVLNDFGFQFQSAHHYAATPPVINEFRDMRSRNLMENALQAGLLSIEEPSGESLKQVEEKASEKGFSRLSRPDISIIALALDLKKQGKKFLLVSDDYSIQNFCRLFSIPFEAAIRGKISKEIAFSTECSACGKAFPASFRGKKCDVCGSSLRQKRQEK